MQCRTCQHAASDDERKSASLSLPGVVRYPLPIQAVAAANDEALAVKLDAFLALA